MAIAKFKVDTPFDLKSKSQLVLPGEIIEGVIVAGLYVQIPLNSETSIGLKISSIEYIRESSRERTALVVNCENDDEIDFLIALNVSDEILLITNPNE